MKVGVLTSGGDAPGMNAAIRSCVRSLIYFGHTPIGIRRGYQGLVDQDFTEMNLRSVANIIHRGGTVLKTSRFNDFKQKKTRETAFKNLQKNEIDRLIVIGGNGSYKGAKALFEEFDYISCGIPGTIDNDVEGTEETIGFDTALNTAIEAIDRIRDTANSHDRLFIVEVMGRDNPDLPLAISLACGAEYPLIYKSESDIEKAHKKIKDGLKKGKKSSIIIVAENDDNVLEKLQKSLKNEDLDYRTSVLGHMQRGGAPSAKDRILASQMGYFAAENISNLSKLSFVSKVKGEIKLFEYDKTPKKENSHNKEFSQLISVLSK
jgi:6-phosphofructokinase 1